MSNNIVLSVKDLKKYFHQPKLTKAIDGISFKVTQGQIVGVLGPNGAGKTTTIQMLLGVSTPTSGTISYFGKNFTGKETEIKQMINFSSAYANLPFRMTVWENLDIYARIYNIQNRKERIEHLLKAFGVESLAKKSMIQLSAGQKTRVMLAKSFLNWPKIILLDEPTASLDPEIADQVRKFLLNQQKTHKVTILITSHNMKEVEELCDNIIFLHHGKILASGSAQELLKKFHMDKFKLEDLFLKITREEYENL
jgi:ABC-2 type transport system ATP-binding protein